MSITFQLPRSTRRRDYDAVAAQTVFGPTDWLVFDAADIRVRVKAAGGTRFVTQTAGFAVSLSASPAGFATVTFAAGRSAGETVRVEGARVHPRITDVTRAGAVRTALMERELDTAATVLQELRRDATESTETLEEIEGDVADAVAAAQQASGDATAAAAAATVAADAVIAMQDQVEGAAQKSANLSDLGSAVTARSNLGLGDSATRGVGTAAGTVAAGDDGRIIGAAQKAANLSDIASPSSARGNLGLGNSATRNVGNAVNTVAAGDDARIVNALSKTGDVAAGRFVFQRVSGSGSTFSPDLEQNVSESFSAGGGFYIPFAILSTKTGGSGHREALHVEQRSSASAAGEFVVAVTGIGRITAGSGSAFGINGVGWADASGAADAEVGGGEFNTDVRRSIARKVAVQIVDVATSTFSGTVYDAGLMIAKQPGAVGFSCGIQFGDATQFPVFAGGRIISVSGSVPVLAAGIDLQNMANPTIAAFVAPPGSNGLAFGGGFGGGLIRSGTGTGGGILTFSNGLTQLNTPLQATGYQSRSGLSGGFSGNYINLFWNSATSKVDLYVDNTKIGAITTA